MTTFKQLAIGDVFEFERRGFEYAGLASGPWRKLSARTYIPTDDRWNGEHTGVGSVNVRVIKEN